MDIFQYGASKVDHFLNYWVGIQFRVSRGRSGWFLPVGIRNCVRRKHSRGRGEGVLEDRKAAPALRARSLRSYVPLRLRPERKCVLRHSLPSSRRKFSLRTNPNFNQFCPKISLFRLYILSPPENMIKIVQNSGALYTRPVIVSS